MGTGLCKITLSWRQVDIFSNDMGQKVKLIWVHVHLESSFLLGPAKGKQQHRESLCSTTFAGRALSRLVEAAARLVGLAGFRTQRAWLWGSGPATGLKDQPRHLSQPVPGCRVNMLSGQLSTFKMHACILTCVRAPEWKHTAQAHVRTHTLRVAGQE